MSERKGRGVAALLEYQGPYFTADQVGKAMGWAPDKIRAQAHDNQALLGFPVTVIGTRTYIPKKPFLKHFGIEEGGNT